jgi:hypothetical protein
VNQVHGEEMPSQGYREEDYRRFAASVMLAPIERNPTTTQRNPGSVCNDTCRGNSFRPTFKSPNSSAVLHRNLTTDTRMMQQISKSEMQAIDVHASTYLMPEQARV